LEELQFARKDFEHHQVHLEEGEEEELQPLSKELSADTQTAADFVEDIVEPSFQDYPAGDKLQDTLVVEEPFVAVDQELDLEEEVEHKPLLELMDAEEGHNHRNSFHLRIVVAVVVVVAAAHNFHKTKLEDIQQLAEAVAVVTVS